MSFTELDHLELAKDIAAYKRGDGPMPDLARLRAAVDSIRTKRADFVAATPKRAGRSASGKSAVADLSFSDLGF